MDTRFHENIHCLNDVVVDGNILLNGTVNGQWRGEVIPMVYGGTGKNSFPLNAVIVGCGSNPLKGFDGFTYDGSKLKAPSIASESMTISGSFNITSDNLTDVKILNTNGQNDLFISSLASNTTLYINANKNSITRLNSGNNKPVYIDSNIPSLDRQSGSLQVKGGIGCDGSICAHRLETDSLEFGSSYNGVPKKGVSLWIPPSTFTDDVTGSHNQVPYFSTVTISPMTISPVNSNVTYTKGATLHISGAPISTGVNFALHIESGLTFMNDDLHVSGVVMVDKPATQPTHLVSKGYVDTRFDLKWNTPANENRLLAIDQDLSSVSAPSFSRVVCEKVSSAGGFEFLKFTDGDVFLFSKDGSINIGPVQIFDDKILIKKPIQINGDVDLLGALNLNHKEITNVGTINGKRVLGNVYDIPERQFMAANNQFDFAEITGLFFNPNYVGSFMVFISIFVDKNTNPLCSQFTLYGMKRTGSLSWYLNTTSVHDDTGIKFKLVQDGGVIQVMYTSPDFSTDGWNTTKMTYRGDVMS